MIVSRSGRNIAINATFCTEGVREARTCWLTQPKAVREY